LCVRACVHGWDAAASPCSLTFLPRVRPPLPPPRPSRPRLPLPLSLLTRLTACLFTPSAPFVAYHLSLPTHLLARLHTHLYDHRHPTSPALSLSSPPPHHYHARPAPPLLCVDRRRPGRDRAGGRAYIREGVQSGRRACVREYGRSVHACVEAFV